MKDYGLKKRMKTIRFRLANNSFSSIMFKWIPLSFSQNNFTRRSSRRSRLKPHSVHTVYVAEWNWSFYYLLFVCTLVIHIQYVSALFTIHIQYTQLVCAVWIMSLKRIPILYRPGKIYTDAPAPLSLTLSVHDMTIHWLHYFVCALFYYWTEFVLVASFQYRYFNFLVFITK